jgi:alpha-L-fucosidase
MLDDRELKLLSAITDWMNVNGEGIFATRPWKISGQTVTPKSSAQDAACNEKNRKAFRRCAFHHQGSDTLRIRHGRAEKQAVIAPLATGSKHAPGKIENVELVGHKGKLHWTRDESGLKIDLPEQKPSDHAVAFKISGKGLV